MIELNKCSNQLKFSYFCNIFISILTILLNIFYEESISISMGLPTKIIFYLFVIITSFIALSQIIFLALISERLTQKLFYILLKILLVYLISSLIVSLALSVFYFIINNNYSVIYMDCPFNYDLSYINKIVNISLYNSYIKRKCINRMCVEINIINNNVFEYSYICNFNVEYNNLIYCNKYINSEINYINKNQSDIINKYINLCSSENDFYICQTNKNPNKFYSNYKYICPIKKVNHLF